jgi:hypothetical protein
MDDEALGIGRFEVIEEVIEAESWITVALDCERLA